MSSIILGVPNVHKCKSIDEKKLFRNIAGIADLSFDNDKAGICVEESDDISRWGRIEEDLNNFFESNKSNYRFPLLDILGEYIPHQKRIIVYRELCKLTAKRLGKNCSFKSLRYVVLTHEISHAVTHLGEDTAGGIWYFFEFCPALEKEFFAQFYTFWHLKNTPCVRAFKEINRIQPGIYKTWKAFEKSSDTKDANDLLLKVRMRHGYETIHLHSYTGNEEGVNSCLEKNTHIDTKDIFENTPLIYACLRGHTAIVQLLLDKGADVNARSEDDRTPLDIACNLPEDNPARDPILGMFRDRFPEAYFTKFCETRATMQSR